MKHILLILSVFAQAAFGQEADPYENDELRKLIEERTRLKAELASLNDKISALAPKVTKAADAESSEKPLLKIHQADSLAGTDKFALRVVEFMKDNDIKVRRSVRDVNQVALPALFQWSRDGELGESWLVDAGVSMMSDLSWSEDLTYGAFGEYHYNSMTGKLKDSLIAGGSLDWMPSGDSYDTTHFFRLNAAFKNDNLISGEGTLSELLYFPYNERLKMGTVWGNALFRGQFSPVVGIQYETGNGADGFGSGHRVSGKAGLGFAGNIFPNVFGNRLTLDTQLVYWNHFNANGSFGSYRAEQWYWVSSLSYWLNTPSKKSSENELHPKDHHFGITLGYTHGDSPDEGEFNSDLLTLGFAVRF